MNMECTPRDQVNTMVSMYFIGFGFGILLYAMPDYYGRRPTLILSMTGYLVAITLLLFNTSMHYRSIALFMIGFFHMKNTSSFVLCFESVEDEKKAITCTSINCFDAPTLVWIGIYFIYFKNWFMF